MVDFDVLDDHPAALRDEVTRLFFDHHLILIRGQVLSIQQQMDFVRWFGEIRVPSREIHPHLVGTDLSYTYISNAREDGTGGGNAELVPHQDYSFADPVGGIALYALEVPASGGETGFIDTRRALERLHPHQRQRIQDLEAVHFERFARGETPNRVRHPVVLRHPVTGRQSLFVDPLFTESLVGLAPEVGTSLLRELWAALEDPALAHWHRWEIGDLIVWDNLVLMHARNVFDADERRTLRRCQFDFA